MYKINLYKQDPTVLISQLSIKRDWMENTDNKHAYNCFPVSLTNTLGWGISFPEDISFVWDGVSDTRPDHVKVLSGEKYCDTSRSNATISFKTGLIFETPGDLTLLTMPVPNQFIDGAQAFTTLMSTSFFSGQLPAVWRITKPMQVITIKAGTPVVSVIPIELGSLNQSEMSVKDIKLFEKNTYSGEEYGKKINEINMSGRWSNFYRNATDHLGNKLGKHELKKITLRTINE